MNAYLEMPAMLPSRYRVRHRPRFWFQQKHNRQNLTEMWRLRFL